MKNSFIILFVSILLVGCFQNDPQLYFPSSEILLGEVKFNQDQTVTFEFTNKGFNPLLIENVNTSCKCLVSEFPTKKIYRNEKAYIHLVYKSSELGNHRESIVVISNDPEKFKMIYVSAKVIP